MLLNIAESFGREKKIFFHLAKVLGAFRFISTSENTRVSVYNAFIKIDTVK